MHSWRNIGKSVWQRCKVFWEVCKLGFSYFSADRPTYARVYELNTGNFVSEIDKEPAQVTVIVHIYEEVRITSSRAHLRAILLVNLPTRHLNIFVRPILVPNFVGFVPQLHF